MGSLPLSRLGTVVPSTPGLVAVQPPGETETRLIERNGVRVGLELGLSLDKRGTAEHASDFISNSFLSLKEA